MLLEYACIGDREDTEELCTNAVSDQGWAGLESFEGVNNVFKLT